MGSVITIHGSDHKSGVTMLSTSVCMELHRRFPDRAVMFLALNSQPSLDYIADPAPSIDDLKEGLERNLLSPGNIMGMCRQTEHFFLLGGVKDFTQRFDYTPEFAVRLITLLRNHLDFLVIDAGNDIDYSLSFGTLLVRDGIRFLVLPQNESGIRRFEERRWLYDRMDSGFHRIILNRFFPKDPLDLPFLASRLRIPGEQFLTVRMGGYARQAESSHQSLLSFRNDAYREDLRRLIDCILDSSEDAPGDAAPWKRLWRSIRRDSGRNPDAFPELS